jgi:hypothetical protein
MDSMQATIFYSWQSDTRAAANRTLIQDALEGAAKDLRADGSLSVEPVLDRDTQAVPGAPDIGATIFEKIDASAAFVADVTIVSRSAGRPTPNPNVLIEVGYSLKSLGSRKIILVQNLVFGGPEELPFDLRQKRVLTYRSAEDALERTAERRSLRRALTEALALIFGNFGKQRPRISDDAKQMLITAADGDGSIVRLRVMAGIIIQAAHKPMAKLGDRRDEARCEAALQQLVSSGLVEPRGEKGEIYAVTHAGYELADALR